MAQRNQCRISRAGVSGRPFLSRRSAGRTSRRPLRGAGALALGGGFLGSRHMMSTTPMPRSDPIAIVGMGCLFPGGVMGPAGFWKLLREGGDAITEIPADRIDLGHYFDE